MANLAEEINNKQSKVICFESYINIFDVVILLVKGFVSKCLKFNNVKLNGLDISPILNEAAAIDKAHNRYSIYYQENVLIKKLFTAGWNIERGSGFCVFQLKSIFRIVSLLHTSMPHYLRNIYFTVNQLKKRNICLNLILF